MIKQAEYSMISRKRKKSGIKTQNGLILREEEPEYEEKFLQLFDDRLESAVDENRLLPDEYSVAIMAMKLGLCEIECSDEDAIELRNSTWLRNGKEEKLKQELLEEIENSPGTYETEYLENLTAEELLGFYRKIPQKQ